MLFLLQVAARLENVLRVNGERFEEVLKMKTPVAEILDFDLGGQTVELGILWHHFPPKPGRADWTTLVLEADQILWEDGPNGVTVDLTGLDTKRQS